MAKFEQMNILIWIPLILLGGWLSGIFLKKMKLPEVLGMTLFGMGIAYFVPMELKASLAPIDPFVKSFALVLILMRAGLGIHRNTLEKIGKTAVFLAILPCVFEGLSLLILFRYFMDFSWQAAGTMGFLLAAVSPAVVVPSMLELKEKGIGKEKEIPTLILAGASVDDVVAITLFSLFATGQFSSGDFQFMSLLQIPWSIFLGIFSGIVIGFTLVKIFDLWGTTWKIVEKSILILGVSLLYLWWGKAADFAALLGVMVVGFIILAKKPQEAQEVSDQLNTTWFWAQIFLFVFIGMAVDIDIAKEAGFLGLALIALGLLFRSLGVWLATSRSKLNIKERLFVVVSYTPKATVQAAMGAVPLSLGMPEGKIILAIAVLSILFTAPLGLLMIRWGSKRLLV